MSSDSSLTIVTMSTKARGATKDMRKPTLSAGTICDRAIRRKKRLKKYLNWWKSTRGTKDHQLYLQLLMALPGYPNFCFKSGVNLISLNCAKWVFIRCRENLLYWDPNPLPVLAGKLEIHCPLNCHQVGPVIRCSSPLETGRISPYSFSIIIVSA